ncbi:MAG: VTC domain-containing protein [Eubacteriales bacterium]
MSDTFIFKRVEKKYLLTRTQYEAFLRASLGRLCADKFGKSAVCNIYYDTPDYRIIRNSIDATVYKEKLRLRSYGTPDENSRVFLEIKKKYKGVVYKRRAAMTLSQAEKYISCGDKPFDSQIMREIDYFMRFYSYPCAAVVLCYDRRAYTDSENTGVRLTFDENIRYRTSDLFLEHGSAGKNIIPSDAVLMEIKTDGAMPLWLATLLGQLSIFPTSFSKYGTAYRDICKEKNISEKKGALIYA